MVRARLVLLACLGCFGAGCADAQHPGEESSSSDDAPRHTSHRKTKKKKKHVAQEQRDEEVAKPPPADDDDAPKKRKKPSHDDSDDDDAPKKHAAAKKHADDDDEPKKPAKKAVAKNLAEDDDEDAPKKSAKKPVAKKSADHDDEDEDSAAKKPAKKPAAKKLAKDDDEDAPKKHAPSIHEDDEPKISDDDDDDDDEPATKSKAVAVKAKAKPKAADDDATPKPKPVAAKAKAKAKAKSDDDNEESTAKPKAVAVKAKAKSKSDDDDDAAVAKRKVVAEPEKPEPAKKQRTIEEDVAIDDPLATKPPVRSASTEEPDDTEDTTVAAALPVAVPHGPTLQDRALTTPEGQIDLHAGLPINVLTITDPAGMSTSSTSEGLALGVAYGFNATTEVGLDYTLGLSPGTIKGPTTLHGAYSLAHGKLDFAGAAALGIDFADTVNPATMTTTTQTAASLQLGAWVRYHATPTVSLFSGLPGLPNASATLSRLAFALPVTEYQIQIGFTDKGIVALTLPIGVGYQASAKLYTFASLNLANIRIANTSNAFLFKDYIPIAIGGFYQFDTLSVGASFADDLKQGFGYLRFELIARYLLH